MIKDRQCGVFLNISSLPGVFGIGDLGNESRFFVDFLRNIGVTIWQTLPVTCIGHGNSPYSSISTYAGNFLYIDLTELENTLLTTEELHKAMSTSSIYLVDYPSVIEKKQTALKTAFARIDEDYQAKINEFVKNNPWVMDYAVFMCLHEKYGKKIWTEWDTCHKIHSKKLIAKFVEENFNEVNYYYFEQYLFFTQWEKLRKYANNAGVKIFGDLPIYVALDSVDAWANPQQFLLDSHYKPTMVAGVPPDYFCEDGQLWGNPLYNYSYMKKDKFSWWIDRLKHINTLYDYIRIDHFRGIYQYWGVPADSKTAKNGKWYDGGQNAMLKAIKDNIKDITLIAEDLGDMNEETHEFVKNSGLLGMRVLQFGFDGDSKNRHLPHNYPIECVAYTGTHDNDTTLGWLLSLDNHSRSQVLDYINCSSDFGWANGGGQCISTKSAIRSVVASSAKIAIIPLQDLCGYGSDTRLNTPGKSDGCWEYRTNHSAIYNIDTDFIRSINNIYGRH